MLWMVSNALCTTAEDFPAYVKQKSIKSNVVPRLVRNGMLCTILTEIIDGLLWMVKHSVLMGTEAKPYSILDVLS